MADEDFFERTQHVNIATGSPATPDDHQTINRKVSQNVNRTLFGEEEEKGKEEKEKEEKEERRCGIIDTITGQCAIMGGKRSKKRKRRNKNKRNTKRRKSRRRKYKRKL